MAARWTTAEDTALVNIIGDGVPMNTVLQAVQAAVANGSKPKILGAVRTRVRNEDLGLDYRESGKDGKFHKGVSRRQYKKKIETKEASTIIVGAKRATTNNSTPTIAEKLPKLSDVIIPQNSDRDSLTAIYDEISTLMKSKNFTSVEISAVTSEGLKVKLSKESA